MIRHGNVYMTVTDFERKLPIYLTCVGKWRNQYLIDREEGWPDFQWIQCTGGQGELKIGEMKFTVGSGQGMLLYPDEPHKYYAISEPWEVYWISFNGQHAREILKSLHFFSSRVLTLANPDLLLKKLHDLHSVAESSDPMAGLECSSITYGLILDLYRYGSCTDVRSKQQYFDQLAPALHLIEDRFHQALTLGDLAARLSVSPQHTCLLFQLALGIRPFEFITKVRLRKAKELLIREPSLAIAEVSRKVGYENPSYFIKMFKRNEGITPKQFRKNSLGDSVAT